MTWRNLMTTFETGRTSTWRLPRFSALYIACRKVQDHQNPKSNLWKKTRRLSNIRSRIQAGNAPLTCRWVHLYGPSRIHRVAQVEGTRRSLCRVPLSPPLNRMKLQYIWVHVQYDKCKSHGSTCTVRVHVHVQYSMCTIKTLRVCVLIAEIVVLWKYGSTVPSSFVWYGSTVRVQLYSTEILSKVPSYTLLILSYSMFYESSPTRTVHVLSKVWIFLLPKYGSASVHVQYTTTRTHTVHIYRNLWYTLRVALQYEGTTLYNNVPNVAFVILPEVSISGNRIALRVLPEVLSKVLSYFRTSESTTVRKYCTYFRNVVCSCVRRYESTFEGNRILP